MSRTDSRGGLELTQTLALSIGDSASVAPTQRSEPPPWCMLCGIDEAVVHHIRRETSIGRAPQCEVVLDDNRVSAFHCFLAIDESSVAAAPSLSDMAVAHLPSSLESSPSVHGAAAVAIARQQQRHEARAAAPPRPFIAIKDSSSNGTYVNGRRVGKARKMRLHSGDEIGLVMVQRPREGHDAKFVHRYVFHDFFGSPPQGPGQSPASRPVDRPGRASAPRRVQRWRRDCNGGVIGRGAHGTVSVGLDLDTGSRIAIKDILKSTSGGATQFSNPATATPQPPRDVTLTPGSAEQPLPRSGTEDGYVDGAQWKDSPDGNPCPASVAVCRSQGPSQSLAALSAAAAAELDALRRLRHPRIVQYLGFDDSPRCLTLLLEYVSGGNLQQLIGQFRSFDESVIRLYGLQVLQGLEYLHQSGVAHGDIKPANILVTDKGHVKLSDFGTCQILTKQNDAPSDEDAGAEDDDTEEELDILSSRMTAPGPKRRRRQNSEVAAAAALPLVGTPRWMSPELIRERRPTGAADMWAFGAVVLEMATGLPPWSEFNMDNAYSTLYTIGVSTHGPCLDRLASATPQLRDFVERCFDRDAERRPSASELLRHPFLCEAPAVPFARHPSDADAAVTDGTPSRRRPPAGLAREESDPVPAVVREGSTMAQHMVFLERNGYVALQPGATPTRGRLGEGINGGPLPVGTADNAVGLTTVLQDRDFFNSPSPSGTL